MVNCDERSIRRRATELIAGNYVWTSLRPGISHKPITVWHITAFCPRRQASENVPGQGLIGNGKRRHDHGFEKTGMAATGRQRRAEGGLLDHRGKPILLNYMEFAAVSGQKEPVTPDNFDRSQRTPASSDRGQLRPLTEDTSVLSQRSDLTAHSGQNCPVTPGAGVRHKESQIPLEREISKSKSTSKSLGGAVGGGNGRKSSREADFLERVCVLIGRKNFERFGGQWTARFREDATKAERVLADAVATKREGEVHSNPGGFMNSLWVSNFGAEKTVKERTPADYAANPAWAAEEAARRKAAAFPAGKAVGK